MTGTIPRDVRSARRVPRWLRRCYNWVTGPVPEKGLLWRGVKQLELLQEAIVPNRLHKPGGLCYAEAKSVTLAQDGDGVGEALSGIFQRLLARYGPQRWWPADGVFEVIVGAILTQSASWTNVDKAMANLKALDLMNPRALRAVASEDLAVALIPSVYFNAKTHKLKAFVHHLGEFHNDDLQAMFDQDMLSLRRELLSIHGIGEETADDIVLYAAGKPMFVIDAYTRRVLDRLGIQPTRDRYDAYQALFMESLPHDAAFFNEYHALLDTHAKATCKKRTPMCVDCCLLEVCPTGGKTVRDGSRFP